MSRSKSRVYRRGALRYKAPLRLGSVLVLLTLAVPSGYAQQTPPDGGDLARMRALEQTPLTQADRQLFLLDGVIWLRQRGERRFRQGEASTDFAADAAQRRAALREQALTDETPYDLVLDLRQAAHLSFVEGRGSALQETAQTGFYRVTLTKAQTISLAERGIAMAPYPRFPGDGARASNEEESKAPAGQTALASEVLFLEDFEEFPFPGTRWTTGDDNATSGLDYWNDVNTSTSPLCRVHGGIWAAWSAEQGDAPECVQYDHNMDAFMYNTAAIEVGPYDDVMLSYWLWYETELNYDYFRRYNSPDGVTWTLIDEFGGSVGDPPEGQWVEQTSSLVGFTDYYVKFVFFSDGNIAFEGAYVDDIAVTGNRLFAKNTTISSVLTGVDGGSVAWGDYDNDGDLDLLLTGQQVGTFNYVSEVYNNNGLGGFAKNTAISSILTGVADGSVAWGDYDNDGDLDILLTGQDAPFYSPVSEVYDNDGAGGFAKNIAISSTLTDAQSSSVAWGDYDNDGDLDILLTGWSSGTSEVYDNDPVGTFTKNTTISGTLTDVDFSSVVWGDYDNDGDLDILLTGQALSLHLSPPVSEVYDNDGAGGFAKNITISSTLTDVENSSVAWGDYDNDGDLDILLTGQDGSSNAVSEVYDNDVGTFIKNTSISATLTDVYHSSVAWGDYDNDGDLDILLTGQDGSSNAVSEVYDNDNDGVGTFTFTKNGSISSTLTDVEDSSVAWGDYDNDGDLDILLTGFGSSSLNAVSEVYDNVGGFPANTPPSPPAGTSLLAEPTDVSATLSWNAATDAETPADGLAYTLRIGTTPGGFDVMAPMSIVNTATGAGKSAACTPACPSGRRKIAALPPVRPSSGGGSPSWHIEGLTPSRTYYWSVQAIDGAYAGGSFAAEGVFTTAASATRYVAPTGSDAGNSCINAASPCRTIGHAVSQAEAGDTIHVAAGTYTEPGLIIDKAVTFQGAGVLMH